MDQVALELVDREQGEMVAKQVCKMEKYSELTGAGIHQAERHRDQLAAVQRQFRQVDSLQYPAHLASRAPRCFPRC